MENPHSIRFVLNRPMVLQMMMTVMMHLNGGSALDNELLQMLKDLRKKLAKQKGLPPFVIFQDPSLEEMCTHYPITPMN
jgi:ATP-dependent DNA helicase RecQ